MTARDEDTLVRIDPGKPKARGAAFILSLIPGGGYMYLGLMNRGLQTLLIFFGAIFIGNILHLEFISGLVIPILMLYSIFDTQQVLGELNQTGMAVDRGFFAWSSIGLKNPVANPASPGVRSEPFNGAPSGFSAAETDRKEDGEETVKTPAVAPGNCRAEPDPAPVPSGRRRRVVLAYILIGLGLIALCNNLFPHLQLERFWRLLGGPLLLIGIGLILLYRNLAGQKGADKEVDKGE
ncbi:MAG: hypothetical protein QHH02_04610 [Syntrophomonadaceae bacterium]|nr:hypothetical protein [Syntrophomonadaceae bacterium]